MDAQGWVSLVKQLPQEIHDNLLLVMASGIELVVQAFMRLDEQYMMIRGRVSGSTDAGRIMFIPYDQITVMYYNKFLKDPEVYAWFEAPPEAESGEATEAAAEGQQPEETEVAPVPAAPPQKPAAAAPQPPRPAVPQPMPTVGNMSMPAKAAMIERLRKRAQGGGNPEQK